MRAQSKTSNKTQGETMQSSIVWIVVSVVALSCSGVRARLDAQPAIATEPPGVPVASTGQQWAKGPTQEAPRTSYEQALKRAWQTARTVREGKNADYIPELAKIDSNLFGIVVMKTNGEMFEVGDTQSPFTIQSISKVFALAKVLATSGSAELEKKIGVNATGQPFNSIVALGLNAVQKRPVPGNPLVNAGAIATVGLMPGANPAERWKAIAGTMNAFAGRSLNVDEAVYKSETDTNARNQGIAWILKADEALDGNPPEIVDLYTRQCSIAVTARDLAAMGATLANGGTNPRTGERVVDPAIAAQVLAVMSTAGLYETTGTWMFRVGAPAKSGVGGGIVAVVPGRYAIAVFSPPLDEAGNSVRAQKAIQSFISELGGNVFLAPQPAQSTASRQGVRQ
jgi:glutaminase